MSMRMRLDEAITVMLAQPDGEALAWRYYRACDASGVSMGYTLAYLMAEYVRDVERAEAEKLDAEDAETDRQEKASKWADID